MQLPFLQYRLREMAPIIPIIIGTQSLETIEKIAEALKPYFNEKNLFIISSDFSHYPSYTDAKEVDERTGRAIESGKLDEFMDALEYNKNLHALPAFRTKLSLIIAETYLFGLGDNIY